MDLFKLFAVLRYLVRHLDWLIKEGAALNDLDAETCGKIRSIVKREIDSLEDSSGEPDIQFNFTIDGKS